MSHRNHQLPLVNGLKQFKNSGNYHCFLAILISFLQQIKKCLKIIIKHFPMIYSTYCFSHIQMTSLDKRSKKPKNCTCILNMACACQSLCTNPIYEIKRFIIVQNIYRMFYKI